MSDKPTFLTERWKSNDGQRRLKAIAEAAREGSEWGTVTNGFPYADEHRVRDGRDLRYADFCGYDLRNAQLQGILGEKLCLKGADLRRADFTGADISFADFTRANLSKSNLSRADMRGCILAEAKLCEVTAVGTRFQSADLTLALLAKANLVGSDFRFAKMEGADMSETVLIGADLESAFLRETDMRGADLTRADFQNADLSMACFAEANLSHVELTGACMYHVDLMGATNQWTVRWPDSPEPRDVAIVSHDPFTYGVIKEEANTGTPAEGAFSRNYVEEDLASRRCHCGSRWIAERHKFFRAKVGYSVSFYNFVQCRCRQCGNKKQFIYDVTRILEKFSSTVEDSFDEGDKSWLN